MKYISRVLFCLFFLFGGVLNGMTQDLNLPIIPHQVYIETAPNAVLYEIKNAGSYSFPMTNRGSFDVSSFKQKRVKKSTQYEVIDITNIHKTAEYDAYVVKNKEKYYLVSSSDVIDNTYLDRSSAYVQSLHQSLKDSVERWLPSKSFQRLMDIADERIQTYTDSITKMRVNRESIFETWARKDALGDIEESIKKYQARRENYYNWVSTLPASVQKDAKILAIPESYIDAGYVGLCSYAMRFINMSKKTIKYLTWSGRVRNAVGDYVSCEVHHKSTFSGKYTGPCYSLCDDFAEWDAVLYNGSAEQMILSSVKIIYTDGSSATIGKQSLDYLTNIPQEVFRVKGYSFFGYLMGSSDEDGVDIDTKIKDELFLSRSRYERELQDKTSKLYDLMRHYKDAKKFLMEHGHSSMVLGTYLSRGNDIWALRDDREFIRAIEDYRTSLDNSKKAEQRLSDFEKRFLGFMN